MGTILTFWNLVTARILRAVRFGLSRLSPVFCTEVGLVQGQVVDFMGKGRSKRHNRNARKRVGPRFGQETGSAKSISPKFNVNSLTVVVVDDDPLARQGMAHGFNEAGHEVYQHIAGATALPRIIRKRPDAVVVDLIMSEMDGLALCREIRRHPELSETVVIIVSGIEDDYWASRAEEDGAAALALKPLDHAGIAEVETIIRTAKRALIQPDAA